MSRIYLIVLLALTSVLPASLYSAECRVVMVDSMPEGIDPSIVKELVPRHARLRIDNDYDLLDVWITKSWTTEPKSKQADDDARILYPLLPGSLVGVIRISRPCFDLRDQELPAGVYTVRYAVQPDLEAHRDSHESRDFLLLLSASADKSPEPMVKQEQLVALSADAIQSPHPAFVPLLKPVNPDSDDPLRRDDRDPNGWILLLKGKAENGATIPMELIVLRENTGQQ